MIRVLWIFYIINCVRSTIIPPLWADPQINPCADYSWQYLFWPEDGQCYPIFRRGPCPETLELAFDSHNKRSYCRCPRGLVLWQDGKCHEPYVSGPCDPDQYLHPGVFHRELNSIRKLQSSTDIPFRRILADPISDTTELEQVKCVDKGRCPSGWTYWPRDGACFELYTIGPCPKGDLLVLNPQNGEPKCDCDEVSLKVNFWPPNGGCYELFTKGPCERGTVFFYNEAKNATQCGCSPELPNFHIESGKCFELFSDGPCNAGQWFVPSFDEKSQSEKTNENKKLLTFPVCECRPDHVAWDDGSCYRKFTRGPCPIGFFVMSSSNGTGFCFKSFCNRGQLYFPSKQSCYKVATLGPCSEGEIVVFEEYRGVSYQGVCGCSKGYTQNYFKGKCYELGHKGPCKDTFAFVLNKRSGKPNCSCDEDEGFIFHNQTKKCFKLFTQGPCSINEWLTPDIEEDSEEAYTTFDRTYKCQCKPGFRYSKSRICRPSSDTILTELTRKKRKDKRVQKKIYRS
ncbi:uncharacterized protein LOC136032052 [Artemia franciscana]|uniref:uncharacterized protein LOC136032052 n=1 Tax=Artemia franciscana TaxID=6661 RepID=UPI0032DA267F